MAEFRLPAKARFASLFIPFLLPAQFISRHPNVQRTTYRPIDEGRAVFRELPHCWDTTTNRKWESKQLSVPSMGSTWSRWLLNSFRSFKIWIWVFFIVKKKSYGISIWSIFLQSLREDCFVNSNCYRWRKSKLVKSYIVWYKYLCNSTLVVKVRNAKIVRKGNVDTFSL